MKIVKIPNIEQKIRKIETLSPSMYTSILGGCAYQFVLKKAISHSGIAATLPPNMNAIIGTITHRLFEKRVKGEITNVDEFKKKWKQMCKEQENIIRNKYPSLLNYNVADYDKMFKAINIAMNMVPENKVQNHSHITPIKTTECDVCISGLLKGSIDLIRKNGDKYELVDYKTGNCHDEEGNIKQAYIDQLNLYSIMFERQYGAQVSKLTIIDNEGNNIDIPFEAKSSEEILDEVRQTIDRINKSINSRQYHNLACISEKNCLWCNCRHVCKPFLQSSLNTNENIFIGHIEDVLGNDTILLRLTNGTIIRIIKMQVLYIDDWNELTGRKFIFINLSKRPTECNAYARQANTVIFECEE